VKEKPRIMKSIFYELGTIQINIQKEKCGHYILTRSR
jgi:hypothetical protein